MAQPFAYEEYRKEKIRKKIEESRASRIKLKVSEALFRGRFSNFERGGGSRYVK